MKPYLKDGKFDGQVILTHEGEEYVGEFKNDKYHGKGTMYQPDGVNFVGEFKDGKIAQ
jgi:hypothetical protein